MTQKKYYLYASTEKLEITDTLIEGRKPYYTTDSMLDAISESNKVNFYWEKERLTYNLITGDIMDNWYGDDPTKRKEKSWPIN